MLFELRFGGCGARGGRSVFYICEYVCMHVSIDECYCVMSAIHSFTQSFIVHPRRQTVK